jgi:hypothetical protein
VDDFLGELSTWASFYVDSVSLSYTESAAGATSATPATTFDVGTPLRPFSLFLLDPRANSNGTLGPGRLEPAAGVTIEFQVADGSALPNGLTLNSATGEISGSPSAIGPINTKIEAMVSYKGITRTYAATIPFSIAAPTLAYSPLTSTGDMCISSPSAAYGTAPAGGTSVIFTPALRGGQPGDVLSNFSANAVSLHGLSLDPNTGVISGISLAKNNFCFVSVSQFQVTYTLTRGSYSSKLTTNVELVE